MADSHELMTQPCANVVKGLLQITASIAEGNSWLGRMLNGLGLITWMGLPQILSTSAAPLIGIVNNVGSKTLLYLPI
jgi:hypothetical protein